MRPPQPSRMSPGDFQRLVNTGEGTYLEFKRTISSPEKVAREIAAFANTRGGILLIGVEDNRTVTGVESFWGEEPALEKALDYCCDPPVDAEIELLEWKNREVVIVRIPEAERKPVYVEADGKRAVFIRQKDKSVQASRETATLLRNETSGRGVTFRYGPNEQRLFRYLAEYGRVTVREYADLVNISQRRAGRILVDLVSAGVLRHFTQEKTEFFTHATDPV